ncbi:MAG TPA: DNA-formamidopyrimidine glycosylase family protein [Acidimicrobiales bacterium]|nr:DNA-formamidopyrimidine glycosylase family protein [Acidimicrobiales bacterium]
MPELAEVDAYRRLATRALGRRIAAVEAPDAWYLRGGLDAGAVADALVGRRFVDARRIGKLLLLDTDKDGPVLGLRFGMSGRLLVDGSAGVDELLYSSDRDLERWDRFGVRFDDGGDMRIRDPRRLGGVELSPPEDRLGPDALSVTVADLTAALDRSRAPLKARLLDQARLAGVGNLAADEILWRAGLDPGRPAATLTPKEVARLQEQLVSTLRDLIAKGGSHMGDLQPERRPGGTCPEDGTPLVRRTVGGRTTWSCPKHQR